MATQSTCRNSLPPGCPEGSWLSERFGAFSSSWRDLFGKRARRSGGLGKRHGAGPSKRVRTKRNASFSGRAAKRFAKTRELSEPPGGLMADRKHGWSPGGGKGAAREASQKCVVTLFAARGPEGPLEPWRCAEAGGAGTFWKSRRCVLGPWPLGLAKSLNLGNY